MASVLDVAAYILAKQDQMTAMKLQKLSYYSQAWHLVWEERPLFPDRIEAWANGPVAPALYQAHRGQLIVSTIPTGRPANLTPSEQETVDVVLRGYGSLTAAQLSDLTHRESPWLDARAGLAPGQRSSTVIEHSAMREYYEGLLGDS